MVVRNKIYKVIDAYRSLLKTRVKLIIAKGWRGTSTKRGNRTKNRVLNFYLKHDRWPDRTSKNKVERMLGQSFENFVSKKSGSYDSHFRRLALATGRVSNHKRPHNIDGFKQEIVDFMKKYHRVPTTKSGETVLGENNLRHKLDYYTKVKKDMSFLGIVYEHDKLHKSGILMKYRPFLNEHLNLKKPLIRMVR